MRIPRKVALLGAAVFVLALPVSSAVGATATDKKQNTRIKKLSKDISALKNAGLKASQTVTQHTAQIADLDKRLKTIEGAAPAIVDGLNQLKDGLTKAGAGLQSLSDAYQAVEYGVVRVYAGSTALPGATLVSPDIPDDGNTATAAGTLPVQAPGAMTLTLKAAIRSNEADGAATGDPAGQVGGIMYATCISGGGCAGGAVPAGSVACTPAGPPGSSVFHTPAGDQSLNLVNIQQKAARTDQTAPASTDTDATGGSCALPGAGLYNLFVTAQFVDLPTSATPGPKD